VLHRLLREYPTLRRQIDLIPELDDPKDLYGGGVPGRRQLLRAA
jgi:hypothetical protein